jgi:hypothetical protein
MLQCSVCLLFVSLIFKSLAGTSRSAWFKNAEFYFVPTLCLCVLCGSQNKQRLFHCTTLTYCSFNITELESVFCAVRNEF